MSRSTTIGRYSTLHQARFLKACVDAPLPIHRQLEQQGISPKVFASWLTQPTFAERLQGVRRYLQRTRELQLEIAALHAATTLLETFATKPSRAATPRLDPTPFINVIQLVRSARPKRSKQRKPDSAPPSDSPLYHADLATSQAEELIRELSESGQDRSSTPRDVILKGA